MARQLKTMTLVADGDDTHNEYRWYGSLASAASDIVAAASGDNYQDYLIAVTSEPRYTLDDTFDTGVWHFAVAPVSGTTEGDVQTFPAWQNVQINFTTPVPVTNGRIELSDLN